MPQDLLTVTQYDNQEIVAYFCHHHPGYSLREAQILFNDLLAWMWLNRQRNELGKKTYLFGPLLVLDEMWHVFILHTRDYIEFCTQYFGTYFHHDVEPIGHEYILSEDEITDFVQDCFEYLGQDWVERRFSEALL